MQLSGGEGAGRELGFEVGLLSLQAGDFLVQGLELLLLLPGKLAFPGFLRCARNGS